MVVQIEEYQLEEPHDYVETGCHSVLAFWSKW
jgi:hypothetical protein